MSLGIGIGGMLNSGGGGASSLSIPQYILDGKGVWLSDRGVVMVDNKLDTWENQGSAGNDLVATNVNDRLAIVPNLGAYNFRDFTSIYQDDFRGGGFSTNPLAQFTLSGLASLVSNWNPQRMMPSVGNINAGQYCVNYIGNLGWTVQFKHSGSIYLTRFSLANMGVAVGDHFSYDVVWDSTGATDADKLKLYINGVSIAPTSGYSLPPTAQNSYGIIYLTSSTTASTTYSWLGGFLFYDEIAVTQDQIDSKEVMLAEIWGLS